MADRPDPISETPATLPGAASFARVPDHELIRLIGRGSYGEVWLGKNTLGAYRAVKIVYEQTFRHRRPFEREFHGVQKFEPISRSHEGLMDILQVGRNDEAGYFYCVMELADDVVSGQAIDPANYSPRTLAYDIGKFKQLPLEKCCGVVIAIASALDFLHGRGLIHRDIKPSNIVFVNGVPKLADIGLVAEISEAKSYVGTEGFIPPEGPGTVQADIYSLGKVLYEISTGKDRHDYPDLPTRLGDPVQEKQAFELNKITLKACRTDPRERYRSAEELASDLKMLADQGWVSARTPHKVRRATLIKIGGFLAVVTLLALGLFLAGRHPKPSVATRTPEIMEAPDASTQPVPAPPGLVAWWTADDNAKDVISGMDGILPGGTRFVPGKVGKAFGFNGEQLITVPDMPLLNPTERVSLEGWVFVPAFPSRDQMMIAGKFDPANDVSQYALTLMCPSGNWYLSAGIGVAGTNRMIQSATPLQSNQWFHAAMTYDGSFLKIYLNGKLDKSMALNGPISTSKEPLVIGGYRDSHPDVALNGRVDELSLYDRALSAAEVQAIYHAGSSGKYLSNTSPFVFAQPENQKVFEGGTASFAIAAGGRSPLRYQWECNGTNLPGATNASLELTGVKSSQAGAYAARVNNALGSVASSNAFLTVSPKPTAIAAPAGIVSWWKAEGSANDSIGNSHGVLLGGSGFAPGKVGQAFSFDGIDGFVKIPIAPEFDGRQLTIEFWMKPDAANKMNICCQGLVCSDFYCIEIAPGYTPKTGILFSFSTDAGQTTLPDTATANHGGARISSGEWHHIAGTYDGTKGQLYIDGRAWGNPVIHPGIITPMLTNSFLALGSEEGRTFCPDCAGSRYYRGLIDEIAIYNRALSADEIRAIYHADSAGKLLPSSQTIAEPHAVNTAR